MPLDNPPAFRALYDLGKRCSDLLSIEIPALSPVVNKSVEKTVKKRIKPVD
jgi:hypothetical protein